METPNKMIGGIAGAMAQQPGSTAGALGGVTNLASQPQQTMPAKPMGMMPPAAQPPSSLVNPFIPADQSAIMKMYGKAQVPGTAFRMEGDSPLDQNAFFAALQGAKESGAKTFDVGNKTYPVK